LSEIHLQPAAGAPVSLDERGTIAADAPCLGCAYNLRGLAPTGNCPECGAPVVFSVGHDVLRFAPVEWMRRTRAGLLLLIIATAGVPTLLAAGFLLLPFDQHTQACVVAVGLSVLAGIGAWGAFLATARGMGRFATPITESSTRRLARVAAAANGAAALLVVVAEFIDLPGRWPVHALHWGSQALLAATFGVASVSFLLHLTALLRRTRSIGLARTVACLALGFGVSTGLVSCAGISAVSFGLSDSNIPAVCGFGVGGLLGALSPVALVVILILSYRVMAVELRSAGVARPAPP
jgi:hypothetical protein